MKITPEQLAALQLQQKNTARSSSGEGFANILTQEMQPDSSVQPTTGTATPMPMVGIDQALQAAMLAKPTEQTVMDKMDSLLTKWENYSQTLGAPDGNLREGYALLADIRQNIQQVKDDLDSTSGLGQELQAVIDELEILSATEEFKFNRGDYLQ